MLRIPTVYGVGGAESQDIHNRWDTMPWVEEQLKGLGVMPPETPSYVCPVIEPGTLSSVSNTEYTKTYESLLGWFGYLSEKLAYTKAMVLQCENEMEYIETTTKEEIYNRLEGDSPRKKPSAEVINNRIQSNARYIELKHISQKWRQLRDCLGGRLNTVEANLKAVSRQIEIRKLDQAGNSINHNIPGRGRPFT